ncbi:unnamed protein product [Darwinula stevensoni]|uniref:CD80-like immunoglobulin C2-set domain-containing protein n=1 Tax=Darwinula stevensoni TaxID=69355 RepID=A0A7R9AIB1_9CRUS|nr:unnamed protein product [Darwinula stevensoni]CAG0905985.1 unnamed protein product [Darwinula stevensoni]
MNRGDDLPDTPPAIQTSQPKYRVGEELMANCTSPRSRPPSRLEWLVNGKQVEKHWVSSYQETEDDEEAEEEEGGLWTTTTALSLPLNAHSMGVRGPTASTKEWLLALRCNAQIGSVYDRHTEKIILIDLQDPEPPMIQTSKKKRQEHAFKGDLVVRGKICGGKHLWGPSSFAYLGEGTEV